MPARTTALDRLLQHQLSAVVFVMDYLQLDFAGNRLTSFVWPAAIHRERSQRDFGDLGYRDALCAFIGHEVIAVEESQGAGLVVEFDLGRLQINPRSTDLAGPEIAMLQVPKPNAFWQVWRPGEAPFEAL